MSKDLTPFATHQQEAQIAIAEHGLPIVEIAQGRLFYRVQSSTFAHPLFYNRDSATRYGDAHKELGVCYVAGSDWVAVAETLYVREMGTSSPLTAADLENRVLHTLVTRRTLHVVDVVLLARNGGKTLDALVEAKGAGGDGYAYTQGLSTEIMRHPDRVDGLIYPSRAYGISGSINGCNLVLFEGRPLQLAALRRACLADVLLSGTESVAEFLTRIKVPFH